MIVFLEELVVYPEGEQEKRGKAEGGHGRRRNTKVRDSFCGLSDWRGEVVRAGLIQELDVASGRSKCGSRMKIITVHLLQTPPRGH